MKINELIVPDLSGIQQTFNISTNLNTNEVSFYFYSSGTNKKLEKIILDLKSKYENNEFRLSNLTFNENLKQFVNYLLYDLVKQLSINNIDSERFILKSFDIISECIDQEKFQIHHHQFIDYYRLNNRYDLVLLLIKSGKIVPIDFSIIHDIELNTKERLLTGEILLSILNLNSSLNGIVKNKLSQFTIYINSILSDLYSDNYSFYSALFDSNKSINEINQEFPMNFIAIEFGLTADFYQTQRKNSFDYIEKNMETEVFRKYQDTLNRFQTEVSEKYLKKSWNKGEIWLRYDENPLSYINGVNSFFYYIENTISKIFKSLIFNIQDDFRVSIGLPKIGQGWVSETNLFNAIKVFFRKENIVQHASPIWLGRQHLDIYFPELNIGIEYQGKQHNEPVIFFGGEDAFVRTIERDERKRKLCLQNNCLLFYVYPETITDDFILKLEKVIKNKRRNQ
jgi:hypothetical protein